VTAQRDPGPVADPGLAAPGPAVLTRMRWWELGEVHALETRLFADPWSVAQLWSELARVPESRWYVVARADAPAAQEPGPAGADRPGAEPPIVGYAGLHLIGPEADVQTVAVAADHQGTGIGRQLVRALVAQSRHRGAGTVHLEVRADNAAALALYRALGFESDGRRRGYYGAGQDAVLMTLRRDRDPTEVRAHG
jgi:[ribosomal protein S18]-alanine N-acetyltransferase